MSLWNAFAAEDDGYDYVATEADAHREWHRNTGEKYGCPQDACHPPEPCHCPVWNCEDYLAEDGTCRNAENAEHVEFAADLAFVRMAHAAEETERAPEPDPWF